MIVGIKNMGLGNVVCMTPALQALAFLGSEPVTIVPQAGKAPIGKYLEELLGEAAFVRFPDPQETLFVKQTLNLNNNFSFTRMHEVFYHMQLPFNLGYKGEIPLLYQNERPISWFPTKKTIGIVNGCAKDWDQKKWPYFRELVSLIRNYYPSVCIAKFGLKGDLKEVEVDVDFTGELSILETAYAISKCSYLITNDSALMHIADALFVPLVCIFGPTLVSKNKPWQTRYELVRSNHFCAPCHCSSLWSMCTQPICMNRILPSDVMRAVRRLIGNEL